MILPNWVSNCASSAGSQSERADWYASITLIFAGATVPWICFISRSCVGQIHSRRLVIAIRSLPGPGAGAAGFGAGVFGSRCVVGAFASAAVWAVTVLTLKLPTLAWTLPRQSLNLVALPLVGNDQIDPERRTRATPSRTAFRCERTAFAIAARDSRGLPSVAARKSALNVFHHLRPVVPSPRESFPVFAVFATCLSVC